MTEAEVSIRLATWLIVRGMVDGPVRVAIDGAQIKTGDRVHFALGEFMTGAGWVGDGDGSTWRCTYRRNDGDIPLEIHSRSGVGDVVAPLRTGEVFRAECKKDRSPRAPVHRSILCCVKRLVSCLPWPRLANETFSPSQCPTVRSLWPWRAGGGRLHW
jgi:hypothetical protein